MSIYLHRTGLESRPSFTLAPPLPFIEKFDWASNTSAPLSTRLEWNDTDTRRQLLVRDFGEHAGTLAHAAIAAEVCEALYAGSDLTSDHYMQIDLTNFDRRAVIRLRYNKNEKDYECYQFRIDRSLSIWTFQRRSSGNWTTLADGSAALPSSCTFRAEALGTSLRMFINDNQIGETVSDNVLSHGNMASFILIASKPTISNTCVSRVEIGQLA